MFTIKGDTKNCCAPTCWTPCNSDSCGGPSQPVTIRFDETGEATAYTKTKVWKTNVVNITCSFGHDPSKGGLYPDSELMLDCIFPTGTLACILKRIYDYDYEPDLLGSTNVYTFKFLPHDPYTLEQTLKIIKKDKNVIFGMREETRTDNGGPRKTTYIHCPGAPMSVKIQSSYGSYNGKCEIISGLGCHNAAPIGTYDRLVKLLYNIGDEDHGVDLLGL